MATGTSTLIEEYKIELLPGIPSINTDKSVMFDFKSRDEATNFFSNLDLYLSELLGHSASPESQHGYRLSFPDCDIILDHDKDSSSVEIEFTGRSNMYSYVTMGALNLLRLSKQGRAEAAAWLGIGMEGRLYTDIYKELRKETFSGSEEKKPSNKFLRKIALDFTAELLSHEEAYKKMRDKTKLSELPLPDTAQKKEKALLSLVVKSAENILEKNEVSQETKLYKDLFKSLCQGAKEILGIKFDRQK